MPEPFGRRPFVGFVGSWLTEWYAYHPVVKQKIGLKAGERMAGFVYIGTPKTVLEERPRPDMSAIVTHFRHAAEF